MIWGFIRQITAHAAAVVSDAPICRLFKMYAQNRTFRMLAQNRVMVMQPQSRVFYMKAQLRTFSMTCRDRDKG